ncbi:MAG: FAD-binding protein [Bacillus sp. (in: firmicutes)]
MGVVWRRYDTMRIKGFFIRKERKVIINESIDELVVAGRAYKADTLEDLVKQIGVDPANFVKAVEEFNKAVDARNNPFGRTLFDQKIDTAPFYAAGEVIGGVHGANRLGGTS